MLDFAARNRKEIFRDPLSIILGVALPIIFLIVFTTIERNAPLDIFKVNNFAPGIIVFGFAFLTMFSALLIAKDKQTALLTRLLASPLKVVDYVLGYAIPMIPLAVLQAVFCYLVAMTVGLSTEWIDLFVSIIVLLPTAVISIFFGLFLGALFTDKQIQGIGTIYIFLVSFLSGAWIDLTLLGTTFEKISYALPFVHAIELSRDVLIGDYSTFNFHFWWTIGYAILAIIIAILAFLKICKR
ncbi:ABC transporter permease [Limosilactobacillus fermentum]|uniref:ABC transporter permease n=1 Tax=Limosilactobacillus fermentum TaxID=1613 RepID=UPI0021A828A7|nr:ABC transporter permease [Limosilactobacillus fermentum]MCT2874633.1 ABC transporter permease [Limosilactobacillus fermentum]